MLKRTPLTLSLASAFLLAAVSPSQSDPAASANSTYGSFAGQIDNAAGVLNMLSTMTNGGVMKTLNGQHEFSANFLQSSGKVLIRVSVTPAPATGDIQKIYIEQDPEATGTMTNGSVYPTSTDEGRLISGVCADGYIACPPGTFSGCTYNKWSTSTDGIIRTVPVATVMDLQACTCFNNYCSSRANVAMMNIDLIAKDFGSGILASFLSSGSGYTVSGARRSGGVIEYFGVKIENVGYSRSASARPTQGNRREIPMASGESVENVKSWFSSGEIDPTAASAASEIQRQRAEPNSMYNLLTSISNHGSSIRECTNTRLIDVPTEEFHLETNEVSYTEIQEIAARHYVTQESNLGFSVRNVGGPVMAEFIFPTAPDVTDTELQQLDVIMNSGSVLTGPTIILSGIGCSGVGLNTATWRKNMGGEGFPIWGPVIPCEAAGAQTIVTRMKAIATWKAQSLKEIINDGCSALDSNPNCTLRNETWDGRAKTSNFTPTGMATLEICKNYPGELRMTRQCRDWFVQKRDYLCTENSPPYTFSSEEIKKTQDSAQLNGNVLSYDTHNSHVTAEINTMDAGASYCEQSCKTRMPIRATTITYTGLSSEQRTAAAAARSGYTYFYHLCKPGDTGELVCPLSAGEQIVQNCTCSITKDMGDIIGSMEALHDATKDVTCSSD